MPETFRLAFEALSANLFRTALTMLGMAIGVAAVILLVSLGNGAKQYVLGEFEGLGTNLIIVQPGKTDKKNSFGPPIGAAQRKMTQADVAAIERNSFNLEAVTGLVFGTTTVRLNDNVSNVNVFGSNDQMLRIFNFKVAQGEFFNREEDQFGRRVVVLGHEVAKNLFGESSNILGARVRVHQSEFRVVGVLDKTGSKLGLNLDEFVFLPINAALRLFNEDKLFGIRAKAISREAVNDAVEEMRSILKDRRDGEEDFTIITQGAMMQSMETILNMLTYMLAGIALISMVVGGIGIMNIMLVSVTERTEEIGIRRAVGARRKDILGQFLVEAVVLALIAGALGLFGAVALTYGVHAYIPSFDMRAPWWILPPALLVSVMVGVVFGVWPASKASRIEPLEALRFE